MTALETNINTLWVLIAAALVVLMQAGFLCLESGLARAKNSINVAVKNLADFIVGVVGFWVVGFGLMFGLTSAGWFGSSLFGHDFSAPGQGWSATFFVFQAAFCATAATICSGAIAERTRFGSYLVVSALLTTLIYPVFGHWAWGSGLLGAGNEGWLQRAGFIDFAGSTVVHSVGGWAALAAALIAGPRIGRFADDGTPQRIAPHNLVLVFLGALILFFGWFGFNCGSTLGLTPDLGGIALNTMLAAASGALSATGISAWRHEAG